MERWMISCHGSDSNNPCVRPVGIRVVCAQFHHRGNKPEHRSMELSRNLETRIRIDRSFPVGTERARTYLERCVLRGDLREADNVAEVDGHRLVILCRHLIKNKKNLLNLPIAGGKKYLHVMKKLVFLLFFAIDHLEEARIRE